MVLNLIGSLLMLVSLANPSADLDAMRRSGQAEPQHVADVLEAGLAELDGETRAHQCMDAFLAGELYRKAEALSPGLGYGDEALRHFRTMRVEYLDLTAGQLGYIGEARVYRQMGEPKESLKALVPLMDARGDKKMLRLAQLEALEAYLLINPKQAIAKSANVGDAADWVLARAYAVMDDPEAALGYARSEASVSAAPAFDRLKLIASLGGLTDDERTAWAQALASAGRIDEALALLDESAPAGSEQLHASLLQQAGRLAEAVEAWQQAIDQGVGPRAKFSYAYCLALLADETRGEEASGYRSRAIGMYRGLVESDAEDLLRRDALRRWFYLCGQDAARELINDQGALIDTDPYLRFARARVLKDTMSPDGLTAELEAVADEAQDGSLRAVAVLMWSQCEPDKRVALAVLTEHWDLLISQQATAGAAKRHRVSLWIGLGMIDLTTTQMLEDPEAQPAESLLMIAAALSERYEDGVQGDAQAQVLRLTQAAIVQAPDDEGVALSAAELMLRVGARADAVRVLSSLNHPDAAPILAEALRETGHAEEAMSRLNGIETPGAAVQRGLCLIDLGKPELALDEARGARSGTPAGGDLWWRATLVLAKAHLAMDEPEATADVLRVSEALYPVAGRTWLRHGLETLKKELEG